ncbi:cytochrome c oxidase assembly protein [Alkalilimnicola sp. S0819]|uniref:cytochrome c oxidase assembly protein n=1 Tax=Alkalilimnicola sp. S0819 TaxID=2613922 RepID=UPI001261E83B|nr:cytochrome c oxidase assembly protein [Alkalilimnicola sp. S0819]KAB7623969.1 cytochrome c oxidase assembly protein [Alkalilimnicola sp. S0819]MPQ16570.1 cytochrome c oxidase assembly protein [Alkalilimnicola sp. S0819]
MDLDAWSHYLLPWEFSPAWALLSAVPVLLYARGLGRLRRRGQAPPWWRTCLFLAGMVAVYAVTQTGYDYLARYLFFAHRAQHLVLHHAAPFLIALSAPWAALLAGLPRRARALPGAEPGRVLLGRGYAGLQSPPVAGLLFVGLVYLWLLPELHFDAMLSARLYALMNLSMYLDGLLFWQLVLDRRGPPRQRCGYGARMLLVLAVALPQVLLGVFMVGAERVWFEVYEVCGRAWPLDPLTDQRLGGLLTWIPAAMMSMLGALVVLVHLLRDTARREQVPEP